MLVKFASTFIQCGENIFLESTCVFVFVNACCYLTKRIAMETMSHTDNICAMIRHADLTREEVVRILNAMSSRWCALADGQDGITEILDSASDAVDEYVFEACQ